MERVAVELTTRMVAALFAFPPAERHLLPWWSDVTMATPGSGADTMLAEERQTVLDEYLARLRAMWRSRAAGPPGDDLVSALAHCENTARMVEDPVHLIGTVTLLVGANDTTRSAISAAVVAFDRFPGEWKRLRADPSLVPNAVSELVRWQTPLAHMRRTATEDVELRGKRIRGGDKVVMWYCSANRDERHFEDGDAFRVERPNARRHLSYGFGIHRCVGRHIAEMQLRVFLEELLERFPRVEIAGEPRRTASNFFAGWEEVPVRLPS